MLLVVVVVMVVVLNCNSCASQVFGLKGKICGLSILKMRNFCPLWLLIFILLFSFLFPSSFSLVFRSLDFSVAAKGTESPLVEPPHLTFVEAGAYDAYSRYFPRVSTWGVCERPY